MNDELNNLGVIITNNTVRRAVYGTYVIVVIGAGAAQVGYTALQVAQPSWLTAGLAVLAYLGVPIGALALANTANPKKIVSTAAATTSDPALITAAAAPVASDALLKSTLEAASPVDQPAAPTEQSAQS
jgi:hypothetical protein